MTMSSEFGLVGGTLGGSTLLGNERHPRQELPEQSHAAQPGLPRNVAARAITGPVFGTSDTASVILEWQRYWQETGEIV